VQVKRPFSERPLQSFCRSESRFERPGHYIEQMAAGSPSDLPMAAPGSARGSSQAEPGTAKFTRHGKAAFAREKSRPNKHRQKNANQLLTFSRRRDNVYRIAASRAPIAERP
jgi:hypothetical protein